MAGGGRTGSTGGRLTRRGVLAAAGGCLLGGLGGRVLGGGGPTAIESWHDLAGLTDASGEYRLEADLDTGAGGYDDLVADPVGGWMPIEDFAGTLDGRGRTIRDLVVDRGDRSGLFGRLEGTVERLALADASVDGGDDTGGLAGHHAQGAISEVAVAGQVTGDAQVGAIVGRAGGTVEEAYALASVDGTDYVGGLVGSLLGEAMRCHAVGPVSGQHRGGLLGQLTIVGSLADGYWDRATTGVHGAVGADAGGSTDGIVGFGSTGEAGPTEAMQGSSAALELVGLAFGSTWQTVVAGESLPPTPAVDGYPILGGIDAGDQLELQGIDVETGQAAITIEADGEVTLSNVTIEGSDD